jgi:hypothetical protein
MSSKQLPVRFALIAAVAALCLATAPAAFAGKGGRPKPPPTGGTGGTISLVLLNSTDGLAHWGQKVTFNVSTTATTEPWVILKCYQNAAMVTQGWEGFFERSLDDGIFGLYSGMWTGGAADCTATLTTPQWAPLASTSFHVSA